ncbi:lysine decarboxylase LdcC [Pantoea sp. 1.19]|uniref:lysine decarboxylase LdcC n=1 Tax=Pantoea sp. 1.19 TaxID=1925589 RepID=UPI000948D83F|nr:lysine decarboxylase LdcC [Pantoea sp. 1.19]
MNTLAIMDTQDVFHQNQPIRELKNRLSEQGFQIVCPQDARDLLQLIDHDPRVCGVIVDWEAHGEALCIKINEINEKLPVYAFLNGHATPDLNLSQLPMAVWFFEYAPGTAADIAQRIQQYTREYIDDMLPPLTRALFTYVREGKYTFCTPGHMAGTAFQKSPVGSLFYDFFGANTMKADISVSVTELGSLLDHSGPHRDAEQYIARTFGAEQSYIVTNGTSTSNKIVGMYAAPAGSTVLIDRNCHKSLTHLLMMTDIVPLWLKPTRNPLGMLGGISRASLSEERIAQQVAQTPRASWPVHAVITHSTYDGLLYNVQHIARDLPVSSIHFDAAWVPYTYFHPIYAQLSAMRIERIPGKVIYETQSTHKLLAAFSQASMIHIKGDYDRQAFNDTYKMHASTSPNYAIVASTETAAAMLRGNPGKRLIARAIERAMQFRREIKRLREESDGWFFDIWQPEEIAEPRCWPLLPGEEGWHGFREADADHLFLDPVKVTLLTPGMRATGEMSDEGIPAALVAKFLDARGIVVEKTGPYHLLFLFSIGIDNTKAMGLVRALCDFKRAYDNQQMVKSTLPTLYAQSPDDYQQMTLPALAQGIHRLIQQHELPRLMQQAFDVLPTAVMTPYQAFQQQLTDGVDTVAIGDLPGRVAAAMLLPLPPGVPLVMPGEMITEASRPVLDFLLMLCRIGERYPGFATDIHGVQRTDDGQYRVRVLRQRPRE